MRARRYFTAILVLLSTFLIQVGAQPIPRTISYQGVLTDTAGNPRPDGSYAFTFCLWDAPNGGNNIWCETKTLTTRRGLFYTILGDQTPLGASLKFDRQYYLSPQVGAEALSPRITLTSVGYSLNSEKVRGFDVSSVPTANTLFPLGSDGKFPTSVIPAVPPTAHAASHNAGGSDQITVTSQIIQDGTITNADISASAGISQTKMDNSIRAIDAEKVDGFRASSIASANTLLPLGSDAKFPASVIPAAPPGGPAGGDLTGTYPNPTIAAATVTSGRIAAGQVVKSLNTLRDDITLAAGSPQ